MKTNIILLSDAYKYGHWIQLPPKTQKIYGYIESRGCDLEVKIPYTKFFGLQGFIKEYIEGQVLEAWMIDEAKEVLGDVFGFHQYFNERAWRRILEKYDGRLPVKIRAVKEGVKVPLNNVLVTIENTDDEFPWLSQWLETMILRGVWYPTTVCSVSSYVKDIYAKYAEICGAPTYNPFTLNDFGARGVSSHESAGIGGAAHLVNFLGTDTIEGIIWARRNYGEAHGYSVMATEHSTTTIYGKLREIDAFKNVLDKAPSEAIVSIVIDSYDTINAVKNHLGKTLKDQILARKGKVVARPDSGDPVEMSLKVVEALWLAFEGTTNKLGFKVLNPKVGVIYGNGINLVTIENILRNLVKNGFSVENIVFGMGGKLLQGYTRDTFKFADKCSWAQVDGRGVDVFKDPVTDTGKKSKRGRLELVRFKGEILTMKEGETPYDSELLLETVFENGKLVRDMTFAEVKEQ